MYEAGARASSQKYSRHMPYLCLQGPLDLAGLHRASRCSDFAPCAVTAVLKIAGLSVPPGRSAGVQAGVFLSYHLAPVGNTFSRQLCQRTAPVAVVQRPAYAMAGKDQAMAVRQPSAILEQEVTTAEVPLNLVTPLKQETSKRRKSSSKADTQGLLASAGYADTLADRIKAGSGRRKTTQSKTHVSSAAVNSLAEAVDAAIAPGKGATECYMDSRDADRNVPMNIPGGSDEQQQHAALQASHAQSAQQQGNHQHMPAPESSVELPQKSKKQKASRGTKPDVLQTACQLAQGPSVTQNVLQEDDKVNKRHRSRKQIKVEDATQDSQSAEKGLVNNGSGTSYNSTQEAFGSAQCLSNPSATSAVEPRVPKRKRSARPKSNARPDASATSVADAMLSSSTSDSSSVQEQAAALAPKKQQRTRVKTDPGAVDEPAGQVASGTEGTPVEAVAAAVQAVAGDAGASGKKPKRRRVKASEVAVDTETELVDGSVKGRRSNRKKKQVEAAETEALVEGTEEGALVTVTKKKSRAKAVSTGPVFEMPTREVLETALQWKPTALPVPNLGYACLNLDLREQKPPIFTNREMREVTFKQKGLTYVSQLALENIQALKAIIQWNHEHGIRFFRMTSTFFPWCTAYDLEELPDFPAIAEELAFAGKLARAYRQRLTFHPSHFVKVAAPKEPLVQKSLKELEVHSQTLDLMGFKPSHWNKINIHIGGVYGDKLSTLDRFAQGFERLSDHCKARLTVENDDWLIGFSVQDLLPLSTKCNIPIVFDFHHHKFCPGDWSEQEAFSRALETWPQGIRPAVHWSESQEGRRDSAHSDYIQGPMNLHGRERDVDVMVEAKCMERCLLRFRDWTLLGKTPPVKEEGLGTSIVNPAFELAAKFL